MFLLHVVNSIETLFASRRIVSVGCTLMSGFDVACVFERTN